MHVFGNSYISILSKFYAEEETVPYVKVQVCLNYGWIKKMCP